MREQIILIVWTDWLYILIIHYIDGATSIYCTRHIKVLIKHYVSEMKAPSFNPYLWCETMIEELILVDRLTKTAKYM